MAVVDAEAVGTGTAVVAAEEVGASWQRGPRTPPLEEDPR